MFSLCNIIGVHLSLIDVLNKNILTTLSEKSTNYCVHHDTRFSQYLFYTSISSYNIKKNIIYPFHGFIQFYTLYLLHLFDLWSL